MATEAARPREVGTALAVMGLVAGDLARLFASVPEVDWDRPTPCTEWNLRDLAEHVTGGNRFTIRILSGDTSQQAMASTRRSITDDHDTRRSAVSSTRQLEHRFVVPGSTRAATTSTATCPVTMSSACDSMS